MIQPAKIFFILVAFIVFQFEISGKDNNDEQPENIKLILVTFLVFQFDISLKIIMMSNLKTKISY